MANPQLSNGYTSIANDIMDALCRCHLGGSESQILWAILRKTYGWKKVRDHISITQLSEITGLARRTVIYAIQNLEAKNMITVSRVKIDLCNHTNEISLQKNYDEWVVQEIDGSARLGKGYRLTIAKQRNNYRKGVVQEIDGSARSNTRGSARNGKRVVQCLAPTKEITTKETIKERIIVANCDIVVPNFVNQTDFNDFVQMRKRTRKPIKDYKRLLKVLSDFHNQGHDVNNILKTSTDNEWQGLFPPKHKQPQTNHPMNGKLSSTAQQTWDILQNMEIPDEE